MKKAVAQKQEPIYSGFEVFRQNPVSQYTYQMQGPMEMVGRNPTVGQGAYDTDANAAHHNALMWYITGEKSYAEKAIAIVNAWSSTLKSITGRDAVLMAGLGPFKMVNAAEILRYTNSGWSDADIRQTEKHFKEVIYPVIKDFAPFANGNWDAAAIKTVMAIGVFCNDREIFERALRYYVNGHGNGRLTNYIINEEGQIQESGRDQPHTQLGVAMLAECSEIAWHQGLDLYSYTDNRLLKGFEYMAKFNLGNEVPYAPALDRTGKYIHPEISQKERGNLRAVYEHVYNHYVNRMGMDAPYTQQAAEKLRPEGPGRPGADHPGYGTLFFTRPAEDAVKKASAVVPAAPGAIVAKGSPQHISLTWVAPIGANSYTVKRATRSGGPFTVIAKNVAAPAYTDKTVKAGTVYYYTVTASNAKGESPNAYETGISAGLPSPWKHQSIGEGVVAGWTEYNGSKFTVEGAGGKAIGGTSDELQFAYVPLKGDGVLTAQYVPQVSSQYTQLGLMLRDDLNPQAAQVSLLLVPVHKTQKEEPGWQVQLITRDKAGAEATVHAASLNLPEPTVTHFRLTGPYWLKLERKGRTITGYSSADGENWTAVGTVHTPLKKNLMAGLAAVSGLPTVTTTVQFDHVVAPGWKSVSTTR
ncbi:alginate lyase family protein [Botryobacter ruber]|uniref:alginate lyase family protein n=1 Tax=Botryobacter ruber TaxID=2171629 RepID=UPI00196AD770|nr:alginate lyase family protein [Botryobacter ruber]